MWGEWGRRGTCRGYLYEIQKGKTPLRRSRRRWMNNIRMSLLEIGLGGVDWIGLVQNMYKYRALVNAVMNLRAP
jgi:hypothetical protein